MQAGFVYLFVSFLVFGLKLFASVRTGSTALYSDAIETLVNIAAALMALLVLKFISRPKDENHPYGHGKAEFISSAIEGGFVFSAGIFILIEAVRSLYNQKNVELDRVALAISIIATLVNWGLAAYLKQKSKKQNSILLNASSVHVMSDVWTTLGVLLGLGLVYLTQFYWIDPAMAFILAFLLFKEGFKILRDSFSGLTDELDPQILNEIATAFQKVVNSGDAPGLVDLHAVRFIRSGHFHHVDAHLVVPRFWSVTETHDFTDDLEKKVVKAYRFDGEMAFHVDPCEPTDCSACEFPNCPIRAAEFLKRKTFTPEHLVGEKKIATNEL